MNRARYFALERITDHALEGLGTESDPGIDPCIGQTTAQRSRFSEQRRTRSDVARAGGIAPTHAPCGTDAQGDEDLLSA